MDKSIIVLTADWQYWNEVNLEKVLKWTSKNKVDILIGDPEKKVGSVSLKIPLPFVVKLSEWFGMKPKHDTYKWNPSKVFARDNNICQYWHTNKKGKKIKYHCTEAERTIDHIIPLYHGGKSSYENCVCSCKWHNHQKGNKWLHETPFQLIRKPVAPKVKTTKDNYLKIKFVYNPNKLSHKLYVEKILMQKKTNENQ